jgi:hypothetical protein
MYTLLTFSLYAFPVFLLITTIGPFIVNSVVKIVSNAIFDLI